METADAIGSREDLEDVNEIEEAMDKIDDLKLEIDGKEEKFGFVVEAGEQMVEEGHHATEEVTVFNNFGALDLSTFVLDCLKILFCFAYYIFYTDCLSITCVLVWK